MLTTKESDMKSATSSVFRSKDMDLITYLRFKKFRPIGIPVEDHSGIRWVSFKDSDRLNKAVLSFLTGNKESELLSEFRRTRSFILDTVPTKELC